MARGHAAHLPRRRAGRRQDVRDAQRGPAPRELRHGRGRRLRRDPRPAEDRRADRRPRGRPAQASRATAARRSRRWTSTRSWPASPQVALVDELAHTNVPGSRNEKRWQDVEELLDAGIDVISTVNIQHLESLNDVVEQITGVKQRETIPDEVVRRADQIELVDMTPEALRTAHGARQHLPAPSGSTPRSPTTSGPATSPRCASSRSLWLADRVDEALAAVPREPRHRRALGDAGACRRRADRVARTASASSAAPRAWPADDRASWSASTSSRTTGSRRRSAALLERQRQLVERARRQLPRGRRRGHRRRAPRRGALAERHADRDGREPALAVAAAHAGSVIGKVIRGSGTGIDVHVISHPERRPRTPARSRGRAGRGLAAAAGASRSAARSPWSACRCSRSCSRDLREQIGLPSVLLLYLLLVVVVAARRRRSGRRSLAAVGGFLLVNWYFTPPLTRSRSSDGENIAGARRVPRRRGRRERASSISRPGGPPRPKRRTRRGRGARPARRRGSSAEAVARRACGACLDARRRRGAAPHRDRLARRGRERRAASPTTPEPATTTIELDEDHVLVLAGRADPRRGPARARRVRRASSPRRSSSASSRRRRSAAASSPQANELRAAILSRRLPRPPHAARRRSRRR